MCACVGQIKRQMASFLICNIPHREYYHRAAHRKMQMFPSSKWKLKIDIVNTQSEMGLHYYSNHTKSCKTKVADEEPWQRFSMRYLPRQTRAVEGHVSLASVSGVREAQQWGTVVRWRSRRSHRHEIPSLKSVLPAHVEDWRREAAQGMLKHFLRTHKSLFIGFPLARSCSGGGDYILLPTLKKMQKPMGLHV